MAFLHIVRPGVQTTVQDRGRWGWQEFGVSVSGAMDQPALRLANALVGNPPGAAVLEIPLIGPTIEFDDARTIAVTGAEFSLSIDGVPAPASTAIRVAAGSRLTFGVRVRGARSYLAVSGGIMTPPILGSRSTHLASHLGGIDGRALIAGDRLPLAPESGVVAQESSSLARAIADLDVSGGRASGALRLRVLTDSNRELFEDNAMEMLQTSPYRVSTQSDRMGFRLEGQRLQHRNGADILSDVMPIGTLQVPASGQPILLMADRQPTGGYARLGYIITADITHAAQLAPGDAVAFESCSPEQAHQALATQERALRAIEAGAVP